MIRSIERLSWRYGDAALLVARLLTAYLFLPSGFQKLTHVSAFAASLVGHGIPQQLSLGLACVAAAVEFFGGVALLVGFRFRPATLLMACFTLIAALISHRYWAMSDAARTMQAINFNKNLAIIGGLLALFVAGPGSYSVDSRGRSRVWNFIPGHSAFR